MIKAIIFDFDMTLVNSLEVGNQAIKDMNEINGIRSDGLTEKEIWGLVHEDFAKKLSEINNNKFTWQEISKYDVEYMQKHYADCRINYINFLSALRKQGVKLGVVSNNSLKVIHMVLSNNKEIEFDIIFGSEDRIDNGKTKSDIINDIRKEWNIKPDEIMYVGDHPNDIKAAKGAEVISVGVSTGLHTSEELKEYDPDILVNNLEELNNHLK